MTRLEAVRRRGRAADPWQEYLTAVAALEAASTVAPAPDSAPSQAPGARSAAGSGAVPRPGGHPRLALAPARLPGPAHDRAHEAARAELSRCYRRLEQQRARLRELSIRNGTAPPRLLPDPREQEQATALVTVVPSVVESQPGLTFGPAPHAPRDTEVAEALRQCREALDTADGYLALPVAEPSGFYWPPTRWLVAVLAMVLTTALLAGLGVALLALGE